MAKKPIPPEALSAALAVVYAALRAEAESLRNAKPAAVDVTGVRIRLMTAVALDSVAERIAPAGTPL